MTSKSHLHHCISAFAGELSSFVQRAQDSFNALKRTVEQRPQAGVQDFKDCLDDLEQQVADFTDEVQQLVDCTSESISFEELIGHCTAVYLNNRQTALALEQHLSQYGYQQAPGTEVEPEHLDTLIVADDGFSTDLHTSRLGSRADLGPLSSLGQQRGSFSTPSSPVMKSVLGSSKYAPSRLGMSQPGSPLTTYKAAAAAAATPWTSTGACNFSTLGTVGPRAVPPLTALQARTAATAPQPFTQSKHDRNSLGAVSNTSSTPAGLFISPGVAALANKYATSSVGGSSIGAMSLPDQLLTAPPSSEQRSPCRDLSLSLSMAENTSPDLPIFGLAPASSASLSQLQLVQHQQQQQLCDQQRPSSTAAADRNAAPEAAAVAGGRGGNGTEDDTTGELYSSLIHSNFIGVPRQSGDDRMQMDPEPVTPPCTYHSCPSSPKVPNTAGRLPAEWHSQKMQELENLQADLTFTLSQMKRTPSRSRLSMLVPADKDDNAASHSSDTDQGQQQQQREQQKVNLEQEVVTNQCAEQQQQQRRRQQRETEQCPSQISANVKVTGLTAEADTGAAVALLGRTANNVTTSTAASSKAQQKQQTTTIGEGTSAQPAANKQPHCTGKASTAKAAVSAPAVAKAATTDLEILMASLSMKYTTAVAAAGNQEASKMLAQKGATAMNDSVEAQPTSEPRTPADANLAPGYSPAASGPNGLTADESSLIMKYAAAATSTSGQRITPAAAAGEEADQLLPLSSKSPDKRSRLAARAAAAGRSVVNLSVASTASEGTDLRHSAASSSSTMSGRPPLAAELVAGMAAWRNAVYMDCPSPLSSISPASEEGVTAAAAAAVAVSSPNSLAAAADGSALLIKQKNASAVESPVSFAAGAATPEANHNDLSHVGVGGSSLLTPATQVAIRQAVEAAGLSTAANRPQSSIRRLQPTTNMSRLDEMRGQLVSQHRGLVHSFELAHHQQEQQQQQKGLAENLENRLAGAAIDQENNYSSSRSQAIAKGDLQQQNEQLTEQQQPDMLLSLRKQKEHVAAGVLQKQIQQNQTAEHELTPRAARMLRRQQQQQQEQQQQPEKQQSRRVGGTVLQSVENTTGQSPSNNRNTQHTAVRTKAKATAADGDGLSGSSVKKGSSTSRKEAAAAPVKAKPVSDEEFASLPGWCKGLLSVDLLNSAVEELSEMMSGRCSKKTGSSDGFTAADLELLGHSSSKSKTIVSCLHKLNRATLQRSTAGSNVYKLTGAVI